jgi:CHAT domain-containing protein
MIHLATHGFFHDSVSTSRPLDQCGLMLAACNTAGESDGEMDGVWLGSEIVQSDFAGTDLVVLSACDTGIGQARMGEGIAGLRHAFHLAGARAVVASLWKANDAETSALMKDFYTALEQNQKRDVSLGVREGVRASLRKAKLKRISDRRQANLATHPVFWAAFDVSG